MCVDAIAGTNIAGRKRGRNSTTPYDFRPNDRRVEVKSSILKWDKSTRRWAAEWIHASCFLTSPLRLQSAVCARTHTRERNPT